MSIIHKTFQLAVCASRSYSKSLHEESVKRILGEVHERNTIDAIIGGTHNELDSFLLSYTKDVGVPFFCINTKKERDGSVKPSSVLKRHSHIVDMCSAVLVLQPPEGSKGMSDIIEKAKSKSKKVRIHKIATEEDCHIARCFATEDGVDLFAFLEIESGKIIAQYHQPIDDEELKKLFHYGAEMKSVIMALAWAKKNKKRIAIQSKCVDTYGCVAHLFDDILPENNGKDIVLKFVDFVGKNKEWIEEWETI